MARVISVCFIYQKLTAASFGPGNLAIGLKYSRWIACVTTYTSHAVKAVTVASRADGTDPLKNEFIVHNITSVIGVIIDE